MTVVSGKRAQGWCSYNEDRVEVGSEQRGSRVGMA